jgi:Tol biopolymer transport system component
LPPETPPALKRLLRRCLEKDARRRWQHIGDVRLELAEIEQGSPESSAPPPAPAPGWLWPALLMAAVLFTALGAGVGRWFAPADRPAAGDPVAFTLTDALSEQPADGPTGIRSFGISQDGLHLAYAPVKDGRRQLYLRALDRPDAVAIPGTENATYPVFSPDGASLAFWADGAFKRVQVAGGTPTTVVEAQTPRGLAWAPGDRIVFASSAESGLSVVSASGGSPEPLTDLDRDKGETSHRWPVVLPDGSGVLFVVQRGSRTYHVMEGVSFQSKTRTVVRENAFPVQVLDTGHLVYFVSNGDMFAAPFDASSLTLTGPAIPLPERPGHASIPGNTSPALSPGGTMVSTTLEEPVRTLVVVGRDGRSRPLDVPARNYRSVKVSPNGRRVAVVAQSGISEWDIWSMDAAAGSPLRRVTVSRFNIWPTWESDDTLTYSAFEDRSWKFLSRNVDLNEPPRTLLTGMPQEAIVLGRLADRSLAYTINLPQQDVFVAWDGEPPRALSLPETGSFGRALAGLSPDGRWLAYSSDQSGRSEVFITGMPEGGVTRQVSPNGGSSPAWAMRGQQLFYRRVAQDGLAEVIGVTLKPDGSPGPSTVVARGDYVGGRDAFDVFPDGSLLMIKELPSSPPPLRVVVNWPALRGLAPPGR